MKVDVVDDGLRPERLDDFPAVDLRHVRPPPAPAS
jgi:hypothetical protein